MTIRRALCAVGLLLILVGCGSVTDVMIAPSAVTPSAVPPRVTFGQSFVARHAGLQSVAVLLAIAGGAGGARLTLRLRSAADARDVLRTSELQVSAPAALGWYRFEFAPLLDSHNHTYYFEIESILPAGAQLQVMEGAGALYRDGAAYVDDRPRDAQLLTQFGFAVQALLIDLLAWLAQALALTALMALAFIVPGLALQTYLWPLDSWRERLALAAALSLSVYPLLMLWAYVVRVPLNAFALWAMIMLALGALSLHAVRSVRTLRIRTPRIALPSVVWWGMAALVLSVRLFLLRSMDAPMLGDSVQHTLIAQLIVDHAGLFDSWLPYAPYATLTVHYGFHAATAVIAWLSGANILDATLWTGQFINFLAVLTLSALAVRMARNEWAGVGVLLVAGLLSPLPHGYANWGRYSQLAGQAVMPVAVWWVWQLFADAKPRAWASALIGVLLLAGSFLNYYRMPHYIALFALIVFAFYAFAWRRNGWRVWRPLLVLGAAGLGALAALVPWLLRLRGGNLAGGIEAGVTQGSPLEAVMLEYQIFRVMDIYLPVALVVLAALVTLWALWRRERGALMIAVWAIGIALLPATRLLRIPGGNSLQGFAILISLYIPIGLLVGFGIDRALQWLWQQMHALAAPSARAQFARAWPLAVALSVLLLVAGFGARDRLRALDGSYRILAPADLRALQWIRAHTPPDALFLVDGFLIYEGTSAVGSDGGWYIPLLAQRRSTMPAQYALLSERPIDPAYNQLVVELVTQLRRVGVTSREGLALLCRSNITHVYVGEEQGQIGIPLPQPMLPLGALESSAAFTTLYRQDKVGVFALNDAACR